MVNVPLIGPIQVLLLVISKYNNILIGALAHDCLKQNKHKHYIKILTIIGQIWVRNRINM